MTVAFAELRERADRRWQELNDAAWIRVGGGVSGEAAGCDEVIEAFNSELQSTGVTATVSRVGMYGLCYAEPLVDIKTPGGPRVWYANVTPEQVPDLVAQHVKGEQPVIAQALGYEPAGEGQVLQGVTKLEDLPDVAAQTRIATRNFGHIDPQDLLQYVANGGYSGLDKALDSMAPDQVLEEVKGSGLRGRGGAAFPTGLKWSFLSGNPAKEKYVLCNCEEGDPGAFNDKAILESDPHTLLEGLILAGYATNSSKGFIFIRQGHDEPINAARKAVADAYEAGLLGENILGSEFSYDAEVVLTGDSYVAGEETALMNAIEGKRSQPRYRPPFPAQAGLWQKPSNINNVKSLSYVPQIIARGGEWFKSVGTETSAGTALVCLTGDIVRPGLFEIPMGLTIRQVLDDIGGGAPGGKRIKVLQTGGPLGGVLGEEAFDTEIDFDAMSAAGAILGSGGIIVGNEDVNVVDLTRALVAFNQFESCGKCFPCRLGTTHMLETLDRVCMNNAYEEDFELMDRIGNSMKVGSLCGHGQLGYNPILSAVKFFKDEFDACINEHVGPVGSFQDGSMITPTRTRP
jgi:NADH:ubiquinone oxidoreductase subunit F (NADH-binding)/(2Fe-2S) ferredoxin